MFKKNDNENQINELTLDTKYGKVNGKTRVILTTKRLVLESEYDTLNYEKNELKLGNTFVCNEIPVKQIGTCHITHSKKTISLGDKKKFALTLIVVLLMSSLIIFKLIKENDFSITENSLYGLVNLLLIFICFGNFPRKKRVRNIGIYIESTKQENCVNLSSVTENDGIRLEYSKENLTKLKEIFNNVSLVRK